MLREIVSPAVAMAAMFILGYGMRGEREHLTNTQRRALLRRWPNEAPPWLLEIREQREAT